MRIAAIAIVHNEEDILGATARHLFDVGVEHMILMDHQSTDGTPDVIEALTKDYPGRVDVQRVYSPYFQQQKWTNTLASAATSLGADWILPFDADEFWCPVAHSTLVEAFASADDTITAQVYRHTDWLQRTAAPNEQPKLVLRTRGPARTYLVGNHQTDPPTWSPTPNRVEIREIPFRGESHFVRKMQARVATMLPDTPEGHHVQYKACAGLSADELRTRWRALQEAPTVLDPIRSRRVVTPIAAGRVTPHRGQSARPEVTEPPILRSDDACSRRIALLREQLVTTPVITPKR